MGSSVGLATRTMPSERKKKQAPSAGLRGLPKKTKQTCLRLRLQPKNFKNIVLGDDQSWIKETRRQTKHAELLDGLATNTKPK